MSRCARSLAWGAAVLSMHGASIAAQTDGVFLIGDDAEAIHLSDRADDPAARLLVASRSAADAIRVAPVPRDVVAAPGHPGRRAVGPALDAGIDAIVRDAARSVGISPDLLRAVITVESGYDARAMSPRGAFGLMQLMPATAREYGVTDPFDARQNILAGARHLRRLSDRFGQDQTLMLAAYNAGTGAVERYGHRVPPYAETAAYVPRVLRQLAAFRDPNLGPAH